MAAGRTRRRARGWPGGGAVRRVLALVLVATLAAGCGLIGGDRKAKTGRRGADDGRFAWPAHGTVSSTFGPRGNAHHDGIDIAAPEGTPVRAALDGTVVYTGVLRGYGKVVILAHRDGLTTVYAHNSKNLVKQGARVARGAVIAFVGRTGRTTGPNLHFEVRKDNRARDPLAFLPPKKAPSAVLAQQGKRRTGG